MEVLWWGALGMDAERAPLGHGWPVGASPHHSAEEGTPAGQGLTSRKMVSPLCRNKGGRPSGRSQIPAAALISLIHPNEESQMPAIDPVRQQHMY